jgi:hypothetical protein
VERSGKGAVTARLRRKLSAFGSYLLAIGPSAANGGADRLVRAGRSRPAFPPKNQATVTLEEPARGPAADEGVRPTIDAEAGFVRPLGTPAGQVGRMN